MTGLRFYANNSHDVEVGGRRVLFHIPTTAMFDLDAAGAALLDLFKKQGTVMAGDLERRFRGRFKAGDIASALNDFLDLGIVGDDSGQAPVAEPIRIREFPLSTLVLNVTTGCNLGCSYCYKEDLAAPADEDRMASAVALKGIELLLSECGERRRVNIVFFGGEPLSNMPLIREAVEYAERRCAELDIRPDFSLTTNATLLNDRIIAFLAEHRFGISVSIDGPKAIHDRHRKTIGGKGTYDVVARKTRLLLEQYTVRPVGARVTVTAGAIDVAAIHDHLIGDMGFFEVGFAPVTSGDGQPFKLTGAELSEFFANMKALGLVYRDAAIEGRNIGFSNMHQLMADLHEGNRKTLPCGAGVGLLAVDAHGDLALCHRFTGSDFGTFGSVGDGIDKPRLSNFLEQAAKREGTVCESCRIRNLCAGGCYHESYLNYSDPLSPTYLYCDLMRDWIDFGIAVYAGIRAGNPEFFDRHITPRGPARAAMDLGL